MTEVINIRKYEGKDYVYIGRGSPFGNPFKIGQVTRKFGVLTREKAIEQYRDYFYNYLLKNEDMKKAILALKDKKLGCYCKPKACHGDVIKEYLDGNQ